MVEKGIKTQTPEPLKVPIIYIKDKQAFANADGIMRLLGPAVETIKKLAEKYGLFHIIDLDLKNGNWANFDIYDKLTYFTHIQIECEDENAIERLLKINARVVVHLPTRLPLERWNRRLLAGIAESASDNISGVNDVIIACDHEKTIAEIMKKCAREKKRVMIPEKKWGKKTKVWAVILNEP